MFWYWVDSALQSGCYSRVVMAIGFSFAKPSAMSQPLVMTNIAIENGTCIVDLPISLWLWYLYWLVVILPLWKIWVRQLGWWNSMKIPTEWTNKIHVPNHQPNTYLEPVACQLQTLQLIIFLVKIPPFISKHDLLQVGFPTFLVKKQSILDFLGNKLPSKSSNSKKNFTQHPWNPSWWTSTMKPWPPLDFFVDFRRVRPSGVGGHHGGRDARRCHRGLG